MKTKILLDIDGTIADSMGLAFKARESGKDWDWFLDEDFYIPLMEGSHLALVDTIHDYYDEELFIWTGRRERHRTKTELWLEENDFHAHDELIMRPDDSPLKSSEWKRTLLEAMQDEILLVIDDDIEVHQHCRELKIGYIPI